MQTGYKIVQRVEGEYYKKLMSWQRTALQGVAVHYIPYVFVGPVVENSPLFLYGNLQDAKNFFNNSIGPIELWKCEYIPYGREIPDRILSASPYEVRVRAFWKNPGGYFYSGKMPWGTVLASMVKLTKRIL